MSISALSVAKRLGELSDWSLSNLALQKISYIAHMIHLGRNGLSAPLITESFEAWNLGPVVPALYRRAKAFGSAPVKNVFHSVMSGGDDKQDASIDEAYRITKSMSPGKLVSITHWSDGAWAKNYSPHGRGHVIPNRDIYEEFTKRTHARST